MGFIWDLCSEPGSEELPCNAKNILITIAIPHITPHIVMWYTDSLSKKMDFKRGIYLPGGQGHMWWSH